VSDEQKNEIPENTGQYDIRFILWRKFCEDHGLSVDTLPSTLDEEHKKEWEKIKSETLAKGAD
jgi:hypothetical protein